MHGDLNVKFKILKLLNEDMYCMLEYYCLLPVFIIILSNLYIDGRCTCEIKCRTAMAKAAFNKNRALFTSTLDLEMRKKIVKCHIWSKALYGAETWTLRAVDQTHLESFEMWCWRRM